MAYKLNQRGYITTKPKQSKNDPAVLTGFSGQTMDGEKKGGNEEAISPRTSQGGGRKDAGKAATGGEIIQNAVYSGLNRFNKGLFSTLDFLLPTEFLGEYDLISKGNDYYSGLESKYSDKLEESTADRSEFVQLGAQTLANTAAAAPNAVLAVMSGGTSAAAQGTTSALTATANAAQAGGMLSGVTNAAQGMVNNPLFWSSVGQNLGSSYENAKAKGANEWQAIGSAYTSALLNSALEVGGGVETLPGALKGGASPFAAWANSALTEGLEEPVQSTVSGLSDMLFYDKDKPLFSLSDPNAVIHPGRMGQEFATGTAVGGILGTGQLAGNGLYMDIPHLLAQHGDYSGYVQEMQAIIDRMQMDELVTEYEKNVVSPEVNHEIFDTTGNILLETIEKFDKLIGAKGAYNDVNDPSGKQRELHAERYYLSLRNSDRQSIVDAISKNSGVDGDTVSKMFDHLIVNKYELDGGYAHFDPDYYIAGSLQRLREGKNIQPHDLILIQHEAMEHDLMNDGGLNYEDAHAVANEMFNYHQALIEWLKKEGR